MKKILLITSVIVFSIFLISSLIFAASEHQAPEWAEMVENGELPELSKRLPDDPPVVEPVEKIGKYGGTVDHYSTNEFLYYRLNYEPILHWNRDSSAVKPNLAREWDINEEGTVYTFYLQEGIKWSDGEPFTTKDIQFWYDAIINNKELTPAYPGWLKSGDGIADLEVIDDYTFKLVYPEPKAAVIENLAGMGTGRIYSPAHYMKDYHPDYVDKDELMEMVETEGFENWDQLFEAVNNLGSGVSELAIGKPDIGAWILDHRETDRVIFRRNPYYWKVDPEGNQLPYIDTWHTRIVENKEVAMMKALGGETDFSTDFFLLEKLPMMVSNKDKGNYEIEQWGWSIVGVGTIFLNQNHPDPDIRELMQNRDFRFALSYAIDREELCQFHTRGLAIPSQATPPPDSVYHIEGADKVATEQDIDKANELLDGIGLTEKDSDGYRLLPSGEPITLNLSSLTPGFFYEAGTFGDMLGDYLDEIGIKTNVTPQESSLWVTRTTSGEQDIAIYACAGGYFPTLDNVWWFANSQYSYMAPLYGQWYATGGESGEEPPEDSDIRRIQELWDQIQKTPEREERVELVKEVFQIHADNLFIIGIMRPEFHPVLRAKNLRNFYPDGLVDNPNGSIGSVDPEQWYFE